MDAFGVSRRDDAFPFGVSRHDFVRRQSRRDYCTCLASAVATELSSVGDVPTPTCDLGHAVAAVKPEVCDDA